MCRKVENAMLKFELEHNRKPVVAMMGLAFKPDIDDLRESPAKYITTKVMQSRNNADILVVEPNVREHKIFKLTNYKEAYEKADNNRLPGSSIRSSRSYLERE